MSDETREHIHHEYDEALAAIRSTVEAMSRLVQGQLTDGLRALVTCDASLGDAVCTADHRVNSLEVRLDEQVTKVIARRQPTGSDLRLLLASLKVGTDLERVGDEAEKLGRYAIEFSAGASGESPVLNRVHEVGRVALEVLDAALNAFFARDAEQAVRVAIDERRVDRAFHEAMSTLIPAMTEEPRSTQRTLHALWCARALERIGDHARNICEATVYLAEGKDIRHRRMDSGGTLAPQDATD